jgi:hypothetical protein
MLAGNPGLMRRVRERGVTLEINLTSNLRTAAVASYAEHPVRAFYKAGIPVTLSTDDPGVFGIDLGHEYGVLAGPLGFTPEEILTVSFQGIDALFLPKDRKREIRRDFESSLSQLLGRFRRAARPDRASARILAHYMIDQYDQHMRTTISLKDNLGRAARRRAREEGLSLSALIARALESDLTARRGSAKAPPFRLVTVRGEGLQPGVDLDRLAELELRDDEDVYARAPEVRTRSASS